MYASFTYRSSTSTAVPAASAFCLALATAERSVLSICSAAFFFVNWRIAYASPTPLPRIRSATSRILRGLCRLWREIARASIARSLLRLGPLVGQLAAVPAEQPRRRKLAQLVPYHVLRDVHRHELVAVVHRQRVADEFRRDRGRARPRLHHLLLVARVHHPELVQQLLVDERALLDRAAHGFVPTLLRG